MTLKEKQTEVEMWKSYLKNTEKSLERAREDQIDAHKVVDGLVDEVRRIAAKLHDFEIELTKMQTPQFEIVICKGFSGWYITREMDFDRYDFLYPDLTFRDSPVDPETQTLSGYYNTKEAAEKVLRRFQGK